MKHAALEAYEQEITALGHLLAASRRVAGRVFEIPAIRNPAYFSLLMYLH